MAIDEILSADAERKRHQLDTTNVRLSAVKLVLKFSPVPRRDRFRGRRRMLRTLPRDVASTTTWSATDTELHRETAEVAHRTPRVHRLPFYSSIYESWISRTSPIRMLEIGGHYGDSLDMWRQYLHPDSVIVGIDVDCRLVTIADPKGTRVRFGGGQGASFLDEVAAEFGPFDVVIDAASQTTHRMAASFQQLFETALYENGVYIVEDVYCDIWTLYNSFGFTDIFRALSDAVRGHYQIATGVASFRVGHLVVARRAPRGSDSNSLQLSTRNQLELP